MTSFEHRCSQVYFKTRYAVFQQT